MGGFKADFGDVKKPTSKPTVLNNDWTKISTGGAGGAGENNTQKKVAT